MAGRKYLTCAVCRREEPEPVVCHHCGKPLCTGCRQRWLDTDFYGGGRLPRAYHCSACLQEHHMHGRDLLLIAARETGLGGATARQRQRRRRW